MTSTRPLDYVVFADESGHTGGNFVDLTQPFFVMGAWVVPEGARESVDLLVAAARASHRPSKTNAAELKFGKLVKSAPGKVIAGTLLTEMLAVGAVPVVEVWEKKFAIATRIVDALCDWDYNLSARRRLHPHAGDARRQFAYWLDENLPDDVMREFAVAFQAADAPALRRARDRIANLLRLAGRVADGEMVRSCDVDELVNDCNEDNRAHRTLHFPAFLGLLGRVERVLEGRGAEAPLVYDSQAEFQRPFEDALAMIKMGRSVDIPVGATRTVRFGASRVRALSMQSSASTPGIQAADALAAAVRAAVANPSEFSSSSLLGAALRKVFGVPPGGGVPTSVNGLVALTIAQPRFEGLLGAMRAP